MQIKLLSIVILLTGMLTACNADNQQISETVSELQSVISESNTALSETAAEPDENKEENIMTVAAGDTVFTAKLADNSSAKALKELLADGPLTIEMSDYASMEKVGSIGTELPRNDEQISTDAGDIILYQGNSIVIYYGTNSWNFTRIGKINGVTKQELLDAFGDGDVTVTFSIE